MYICTETYIHTSVYNRLNCGKNLPNIACCYVNCNCQSKLSVLTNLDEYEKSCLEKPVPHQPGASASLDLAHLSLEVFFLQ